MTIFTKYLGPTNTKPGRIKAYHSWPAKNPASITVEYNREICATENHIAAAKALCKKYNWRGRYVCGDLAAGCVFVKVNGVDEFTIESKPE